MNLTDLQRTMIRWAATRGWRLSRTRSTVFAGGEGITDMDANPIEGVNIRDRQQVRQSFMELMQLVAHSYFTDINGDGSVYQLEPAGERVARELGYLPAN